MTDCPFTEAVEDSPRRLKVILWGDTGTGKTPTALQFPSPVVVDMEKGTVPFQDKFAFGRMHATTPEELMKAIRWLGENKHTYKTVVVDPLTVYWESLQKKWSEIFLLREKGTVGFKHEFFDFQPTHWGTIKDELKEMLRALFNLDMNIIVTCREKARYKDTGFMIKDGVTHDGEKNLPYWFDVNIHCIKDDEGKRKGVCIRDRYGRLPEGEDFPLSYRIFEKNFSDLRLNDEAEVTPLITEEQRQIILTLIAEQGYTPEQLGERLLGTYGVTAIERLSQTDADEIISKTREAMASKPVIVRCIQCEGEHPESEIVYVDAGYAKPAAFCKRCNNEKKED